MATQFINSERCAIHCRNLGGGVIFASVWLPELQTACTERSVKLQGVDRFVIHISILVHTPVWDMIRLSMWEYCSLDSSLHSPQASL